MYNLQIKKKKNISNSFYFSNSIFSSSNFNEIEVIARQILARIEINGGSLQSTNILYVSLHIQNYNIQGMKEL